MTDFFNNPCGRVKAYCEFPAEKPCRSSSCEPEFGIIDDLSKPEQPAYIQEFQPREWTVTISKIKKERYQVNFKAIDNCVIFPSPPGLTIRNNICDGMLFFRDWLIFIELKDNDQTGYPKKAQDQLSRSIQVFAESHPEELKLYTTKRAYISNKAKLEAPNMKQTDIDKFADENFDFELFRSIVIKLP